MEDNRIGEERNVNTKGKAKRKCMRKRIQSGSGLQIGSINLTVTKPKGVATVERRKTRVSEMSLTGGTGWARSEIGEL